MKLEWQTTNSNKILWYSVWPVWLWNFEISSNIFIFHNKFVVCTVRRLKKCEIGHKMYFFFFNIHAHTWKSLFLLITLKSMSFCVTKPDDGIRFIRCMIIIGFSHVATDIIIFERWFFFIFFAKIIKKISITSNSRKKNGADRELEEPQIAKKATNRVLAKKKLRLIRNEYRIWSRMC